MHERLLNYVREEDLFLPTDTILLGVSGGIDSMVMADLFLKAGLKFGIAHCNFKLRDSESDGDETFVREFAEKNNIPVHSRSFDTRKVATEGSISIQMAARNLRIEWFTSLCHSKGYTCIALAHHQDDQHETFFINLFRGTGIAGLRGIPPRSGMLVHPLLFASRKELMNYARKHSISYREDRSNHETEYLRNKVRHLLIPVVEQIMPGSSATLTATINNLKAFDRIYRNHLEDTWKALSTEENEIVKIDTTKLKELPEITTYLFEFLQPFGFNASAAEQIEQALEGFPGKQFLSPTHRLILDRDVLLIEQTVNKNKVEYLIESTTRALKTPIGLSFSYRVRNDLFKINKDDSLAQLDADRLKFPLSLRPWKEGDHFFPLGMRGKKLLSDFFIDRKFSLIQKERCWILLSGSDIAWIVGHQLDDRFKVSPNTKSILEIRLHPPV